MSDLAIKVEGLGKKYKIGRKRSGDLRESFSQFINKFRQKNASIQQLNNLPAANAGSTDQPTKEFWALKDINFEVKQGEAVGIIGKNGAGKSTLLKVLSRITKPTTGKFEINGRVSSLLEVGTGFHMELSGRENIYLNGTILGMKRREIKSKFDEIVAFSGVEKFIDTPVKHYSSGMKVRLAFSVAAHLEPEILIIDEVLAVGDAEFQRKCLGKMEDVTVAGRTVLFVSHNLAAVEKLCRKGILLKNGTLNYLGTSTQTISKYLTSSNKQSDKSLKFRSDRKGSGKILITRIELYDWDNNEIENVLIGQDIMIVFEYEVIAKFETSEKLNFGIGIKDESGTPIFLHHFRLIQKTIQLKTLLENSKIIFKLKKWPFLVGRYNLHYSLLEGSNYIDHITNALSISVIEGNIYNYSEYPPSSQGKMLVNGNWEIS